jgi:hypothetical protein
VIKTVKGVFHLLILVVDLAMDGAQRLNGWQWHAMIERWSHWGVALELLLVCYGRGGSTSTSLNQSGGHGNPYLGLLEQ